MSIPFNAFFKLSGITPAVIVGILTKVWTSISGLVIVALISRFFSPEEQGYYYTFTSFLGLQGFFEFGLSTVMVQFFAHELAHLDVEDKGRFSGDPHHRDRVMALLSSGARYSLMSGIAFLLGVILVAHVFFSATQGTQSPIEWEMPLFTAAAGTSLSFLLNPVYAFITGGGGVAQSSRIELTSSLVASIAAWTTIALEGGLYTLGAYNLTKFSIGLLIFVIEKPRLLTEFARAFKGRQETNPSQVPLAMLREEFWPMQWRVALSWMSGYLIFQLFVPVLFRTQGAVVAGQMGMTLSMTNAIQSIGLLWITTRVPDFCALIAKRNWKPLERLFRRTNTQSLTITGGIAVLFLISLSTWEEKLGLTSRLLPLQEIALLLGAAMCQIQISAWATYMRAHKQETMALQSVIGACLTAPSLIFLGAYFSSLGMVTAFALLSLGYGIPSTYVIWRRFKKFRHNQNQAY